MGETPLLQKIVRAVRASVRRYTGDMAWISARAEQNCDVSPKVSMATISQNFMPRLDFPKLPKHRITVRPDMDFRCSLSSET
jgi:hypothetical protein